MLVLAAGASGFGGKERATCLIRFRDVVYRVVHNFSLSPFPYSRTLVDADTGAAVEAREAAYVRLRGED